MLAKCALVEQNIEDKPVESLASSVTNSITDSISSAEAAAVSLVDTTAVPEMESVDSVNTYNKLLEDSKMTTVTSTYEQIQACLDNQLCPNHNYSSKLNQLTGIFDDLKISSDTGKIDLTTVTEFTGLDSSLQNNVNTMKSDLESSYSGAATETIGQVDSFRENVNEIKSVAPTKPAFRGAIGV